MEKPNYPTPVGEGKLQRFAIITAYSMAVLCAMGYLPGAEMLLGLAL